ncbi:MAG: tRNA uridine(34) 5-carboxymethylaminomethyl modification radical SAM/GNAT enzyme Elp3 [Candidatus Dojkabacteria bacterium]|jgi:elongator complex protein 3|nr:tRNA uridine(34) 5-carboxymethylaminomethyl modification radical SAM/GNAT enzyme Elp3 [Candidatus Dojkabacteria bacterium]
MEDFKNIFQKIEETKTWRVNTLQTILKKYPKQGKGLYRHDDLVKAYRELVKKKEIKGSKKIEERIRMKPTRTQSGVATVTVLMRPFMCPGMCIFCPNEPNMPKSYIASEPGAQRALTYEFDPYLQTYNRIKALQDIGHNTEKIELIILGGTCSVYPEEYIIWFVKRCFDAMNSFGSKNYEKDSGVEGITWEQLEQAQHLNESTVCRNVGLVLETRPDYITKEEVIRLRRLGATKVQIGLQSLDDDILNLNLRGHTTKESKKAFELLRLAGFKIHAHWMPNLYGSNVKKDIKDFKKLWGKEYSPDELKIYPTSIIRNTVLEKYYNEGKYTPYTHDELLKLFTEILPLTPRYNRLTRIVRDIPSNEILAGNKSSNFRQIAEEEIRKRGKKIEDIRSREIKDESITWDDIELETIKYDTTVSKEYFISYKTKDTDRVCSFLRLSIPKKEGYIDEIKDSSMIREVHVYGTVVNIGKDSSGESQHLGLGKRMIEIAEEISKREGFRKISVITAIGTKLYYEKRGFVKNPLYMIKVIK